VRDQIPLAAWLLVPALVDLVAVDPDRRRFLSASPVRGLRARRTTLIDAPVVERLGFNWNIRTQGAVIMANARWMQAARDLTATPGEASNYLTVGELSDLIGLAPGTIKDSITRSPITNTTNPRSAICRPAARISDLPLWSREQVDEFLAIAASRETVSDVTLELVSVADAYKRRLFSLVEFAEMFDVHDQTLRRAQSQDGEFPRAVARRSTSGPGVPEHLFEQDAMFAWAASRGYAISGTTAVAFSHSSS
jgi:hypothetical protein